MGGGGEFPKKMIFPGFKRFILTISVAFKEGYYTDQLHKTNI